MVLARQRRPVAVSCSWAWASRRTTWTMCWKPSTRWAPMAASATRTWSFRRSATTVFSNACRKKQRVRARPWHFTAPPVRNCAPNCCPRHRPSRRQNWSNWLNLRPDDRLPDPVPMDVDRRHQRQRSGNGWHRRLLSGKVRADEPDSLQHHGGARLPAAGGGKSDSLTRYLYAAASAPRSAIGWAGCRWRLRPVARPATWSEPAAVRKNHPARSRRKRLNGLESARITRFLPVCLAR